ncbi:hypothetical protein [Paraburkholderia caribensis]|nr:hypothetical protein [Paraburkholderia caribensis]
MTTSNQRTQAGELASARAAKKLAEASLYQALIARQRERYAAAYGRCVDTENREAARAMFTGAALFEGQAKRIPSRAKKAVEALKLAVFLLDPKAPA